jgi:oligoribonuclease
VLGIFLDSEANGLNPLRHKILEFALKILDMETGEQKTSYETMVKLSHSEWERSDKESLKVNGFTWEEVSQGKEAALIAEEVIQLFTKWDIKRGDAVFICQNPSFDRAFFSQIVDPDTQEKLNWPYHWLDLASMYWAESIRRGKTNPLLYPWKTGVSKDRIAAAYKLPPEEKPHRALNGANHLLLCYQNIIGFPGQ